MRIIAISDTHNQHKDLVIPDCDVLIHAGDFSNRGTYTEAMTFIEWFASQKAKHKIFIAGNHDHIAQKEPYLFSNLVPRHVTYLNDSEHIIDNIKFYGSPWTPFFYDWSFNGIESREEQGTNYIGGPGSCTPDDKHPLLAKVFSKIPLNTNVMICHGPVRAGNLDITREGVVVGSRELTKAVEKLPSIRAVIGGHIHEGYGHYSHKGINCYNVASMTRDHKLINPPMVIDL